MSTATITREQAEAVLADVKARYRAYFNKDEDGPTLVMDYDYLGMGEVPTVVWEQGPYEWAYRYTMGGHDEETALLAADVIGRDAALEAAKGGRFTEQPAACPEGVNLECMTSWAVSIYPAS